MPIVKSKAQNRWAHWAAKHGKGKTRKAAKDAVREFHGKITRGMPERKASRKRSRKRGRA